MCSMRSDEGGIQHRLLVPQAANGHVTMIHKYMNETTNIRHKNISKGNTMTDVVTHLERVLSARARPHEKHADQPCSRGTIRWESDKAIEARRM
jgi:hypothetical protein